MRARLVELQRVAPGSKLLIERTDPGAMVELAAGASILIRRTTCDDSAPLRELPRTLVRKL